MQDFFIWFADITMILYSLHQNIEAVICSACVHLREREGERLREGEKEARAQD